MTRRARKDNVDLLKIFLKASPRRRKILLQDGELMQFIMDCCSNFLHHGNMRKLNQRVLNRLGKHKNLIRQLANHRTSKERRKQIVARASQSGGFLHILAPLALRLLGGLVKGLTG